MDKLFSPEDIRKYFYTSCFLALVCLLAIIYLAGISGWGNVYVQNDILAKDVITSDIRTYSGAASEVALAKGATSLEYHSTRDWGVQPGGESGQTLTSSYVISGASGGYQNQYVVKTSGSGYKHTYQATKIRGDFVGSSNSVVLETGVPSVDSLILMDGNATFRGRIISGWTGRPITEFESDVAANATIRSYLNLSMPQTTATEEDWLGFCEKSRLAAIAEDGGFYILPAGYDLDESGNPYMNRTKWEFNTTSKTFQVKPGVI